MKKEYTNPVVETVKLELVDIICISIGAGGDGTGGSYTGLFGN